MALVATVGALLVATSAAAEAAQPMTLLLAKAQGRGTLTLGTGTSRLHGGVWLYRIAGRGVADGSAQVDCSARSGGVSTGGNVRFTFRIKPGGRQQLWSYSGRESCTVTTSLRGGGVLRIQLRGF